MAKKLNLIPVGYITKTVADVRKGDVVEGLGKIAKSVYIGKNEFTLDNGETITLDSVELKVISTLTGKNLFFVLPFIEPAKILQYENPDDYEFEFLPLKSTNLLFNSKEDSSYLDVFAGDESEDTVD